MSRTMKVAAATAPHRGVASAAPFLSMRDAQLDSRVAINPYAEHQSDSRSSCEFASYPKTASTAATA
jgi:hypothetical protein